MFNKIKQLFREEKKSRYDVMRMLIHQLPHKRFTEEEIKELVEEITGIDVGDMKNHFIDGTTFSNLEVYDNLYSFNLEDDEGDIMIDIYILNTNEPDVFYVSEVSFFHDSWKLRPKEDE